MSSLVYKGEVYAHGTSTAYDRCGCRCEVCRGWQAHRVRRNRKARLAAGRLTHGTRSAYDAGCRCPACKDARKIRYQPRAAAS